MTVVLAFIAVVVAALVFGWKLSSANAIHWRTNARIDRDIAVCDEADMGEVR